MIRVGVLRGGKWGGHKKSITIGSSLLSLFQDDNLNQKYKVLDIYLDDENVLHLNGIPTNLEKIYHNIDIVLNTLNDENIDIKQALNHWNIVHTGSDMFVSARLNNKLLTKEHLALNNFKTIKHIFLKKYEEDFGNKEIWAQKNAKKIWSLMPPPWQVTVNDTYPNEHILCMNYNDLVNALNDPLSTADLLIEEYISGREMTVHIVENFRDKDIYAFPSVENKNTNGQIENICPANILFEEKDKLEKMAINLYKEFGLKNYGFFDFKLTPSGSIYVSSIGSIPETNSQSLSFAIDAVGANYAIFLDNLIINALRK